MPGKPGDAHQVPAAREGPGDRQLSGAAGWGCGLEIGSVFWGSARTPPSLVIVEERLTASCFFFASSRVDRTFFQLQGLTVGGFFSSSASRTRTPVGVGLRLLDRLLVELGAQPGGQDSRDERDEDRAKDLSVLEVEGGGDLVRLVGGEGALKNTRRWKRGR